MPTTVVAEANQTLCELAIAAGFVDCQPIRDLADNAGKPFLTKPLAKGDRVVIPDVDAEDHDKPVEQEHKFEKKNAPAFLIRFVHGSPDKPYRQDSTLDFLNVSNFITNKAGSDGTAAFASTTVFNTNADADPDTFKIEVVDPSGPATVTVKLEALKAVFDDTGALDHHESFTDALAPKRTVSVDAKIVSSKVCYRSAYLRLVVDEEDQAAVPKQTLLVTDMADGAGGDNDRVEILDQLVRASYERVKCPGSPKCTAVAELPIAPEKQRVNLCMHGVRANVGDGSTAIGGVTEANMRRRTMRWFRRLYAQAQFAPKLVDPFVEFVDPPSDNMIVVGDHSGAVTSGVDSTGKGSSLTFTLTTSPPRGASDPADPVVTVSLASPAPLLPGDVGGRIAAALPAGFAAQVEVNCRATDAANGSCDILITRQDNKRVVITNESTTDTGLLAANGFAVCRVKLAQVNIDVPFAALLCCNMQVRRVLRCSPGRDGRIDIYIVGGLFGTDKTGAFALAARGLAQVPGLTVPAPFQPNETMRFAALMGNNTGGTAVMDGGDHDPYSFPHECGHVLHDGFHTKPGTSGGDTELMTGDGTSDQSAVDSSKRICDFPIKILYQVYNPDATVQAATPGAFAEISVSGTLRMTINGASVFGAF